MGLLMLMVMVAVVVGPIVASNKKSEGKRRAALIHAVFVGGWLCLLLLFSADPGSTTSAGPHVVGFFATVLFWLTVMIDLLALGLMGTADPK